jgi:hypothetical protein
MKIGRHRVGLRSLRKVRRDLQHRVLGLPWMRPEPRDCFIASWPRSGNTWLRHMLFFYFNPGAASDMATIDRMIPVIDSIDLQRDLAPVADTGLRLIKSHEEAAAYFLTGKVIYIVRDGRDATYSWYHFRRKLYGEEIAFDAFLDRCLRDGYRYRSWHTNVAGWLAYRDHPHMLLLHYEAVMADPQAAFASVLRFIGLVPDADRIAGAVAQSSRERVGQSFQSMVQARGKTFSGTAGGPAEGRWRDSFTPAQQARFVSAAGATLTALGYPLD